MDVINKDFLIFTASPIKLFRFFPFSFGSFVSVAHLPGAINKCSLVQVIVNIHDSLTETIG